MNKPSKIALALAFAATTVSGVAMAQQVRAVADPAVIAQNIGTGENNWVNVSGLPWMNGTNEHCWRNAFWTPATGLMGCDGTIIAQAAPPAPPPAVAPVAEKVVYDADTFFDFDKTDIKPDGRQMLDELVRQVNNLELEVIIAVGHTDSIGTDAYNQGLSERRANAVKQYLVGRGIDPNRIYTEGKGESQPVASNATREGRAQNRRVELEVVGTRRK
ncbi:OmpA family protein [Verticiella sediminum]|uniref:OmpA family protein n=1 Tax=Verticiella sediminum TaxID=1247510 RepID=A0A556AKJ2_9BURK|nr:OmpA family protein [Verticiella sediminum]TSH93408.1 OmpA family protein [Verticiella sediminum]